MRLIRSLALLAALAATAAAAERTPLVVRPLDEVHLKDGDVQRGRVTDKNPDTIVLRKPNANGGPPSAMPIQRKDIERIDEKQSAAEAVKKRGDEDLASGDTTDLKTTLKWGMDNGAKDAALDLAKLAMSKRASNDLAEAVVPMLEEQQDYDSVAAFIVPLLTADAQWTFGYEHLAKAYEAQKRDGDLLKLVDAWLERQPAAQTPNRIRAGVAERSGDLRAAQEAYRKGFDNHKSLEAGLGYARTSLRLGELAKALQTAEALVQAGQFVDEANAITGGVLLAQGDEAGATKRLRAAIDGKLSPETAEWVRYDLGLLAYRGGAAEQARGYWKDLTVPAARLGMAMLDHRPFPVKDAPPELKDIATEYDACVDLENSHFDDARAALDPKRGRRQSFLLLIAALKYPTDEAVKALAAVATPESLRWQAYAHILVRRWAQAEAVLAQLPPNDGYAAVCRVYLAEARKDSAGARTLFAQVRESVDPPRDYVDKLALEYEGADDYLVTEKFDQSPSELQTRDWKMRSAGTGIEIKSGDGHLVLTGKQAATDDPVTSAYQVVKASALRSVQATLDTSAVNGAVAGIELLDSARANGVQLAVIGDHLGWRQAKDGQWSEWQPLPIESRAAMTLRLRLERGAVSVETADDPPQARQLASGVLKDQVDLCVGVFGFGNVEQSWTVSVSDFALRLRGAPKPQGH